MKRRKIDSDILSDIQYKVFNPRDSGQDSARLVSETYHYWSSFWTNQYKQLNTGDLLYPLEFFKQDKITGLIYKDKIVANHDRGGWNCSL